MPANDGVRGHDLDGAAPLLPYAGESHPDEAIERLESQARRRLPTNDGQLVVEGEDLERQRST
jgi:hypothetical protein